MSHTKGPWYLKKSHGMGGTGWDLCYGPETVLAHILCFEGPRSVESVGKLIAAAPDLLAALKKFVATIDDADEWSDPGIDVAFTDARAAIEKAEGR